MFAHANAAQAFVCEPFALTHRVSAIAGILSSSNGWCRHASGSRNATKCDKPERGDHINRNEAGGARRNRTADLFNAIEALSQLSYDPTPF
jgi:hypothetical protein